MITATAAGRLLRPQQGAVANARDALRLHVQSARERREVAAVQAAAHGVGSWARLGPVAPDEDAPSAGGRHAVRFGDEVSLSAHLAAFVTEGLAAGEVCVVVATHRHLAGLRSRLVLAGFAEQADRLLVPVDADALVLRLLRDGRTDADLFDRHVARPMRAAAQRGSGLRVFGELAALLSEQAGLAACLELESRVAALQVETGSTVLCSHPVAPDPRTAELVRRRHSHLAS